MNIYYIGSMDDIPSAGRGPGKRERPIDISDYIRDEKPAELYRLFI